MPRRLLLLLTLAAGLSPRPAAALDLPVRDPRREGLIAACYRGDRLELRLRAPAARVAREAVPSAAVGDVPRARLGLPAVDEVARALGGATFEAEFRGEAPPVEGSRQPDFTAFYLVNLPEGIDLERALSRFRALGEVESVAPIAVMPMDGAPNDSLWSQEYWLYQASRRDVHAPEAWSVTTGDTAVVVGVVDTGVLAYHPDLGGLTPGGPSNLWTNDAELVGVPGVDDDGNGFVDDAWGWDFVNLSSGTGVVAGEDWRDQDNDPNDFAAHGTIVSGLIAAMANNAIGLAGLAPHVRIMALRMAWSDNASPFGLVDMAFAAQAIRYATRMGADVLNCSFATANESGIAAALTAATDAGVIVVFSSGNSGSRHDMAEREDVISVGATDAQDVVPGFSNRGTYVDLSAPGVSMLSTYVQHFGSDSLSLRTPSYIPNVLSGTSFSTPLATAAAALVQSARRQAGLRPLQPIGMLLRLRETTDDISAQNPSISGYGTGRLNAARALLDRPTSSAWQAAAHTTGAAVLYRSPDGLPRTAWLTSDQKLLIVDTITGDTVRVVPLPGPPTGHLAGADLGVGAGFAMFASTTNGKVAGFDAAGDPLPGWPVSVTGLFTTLGGGPALGDLDGDGALEVVAGVWDGKLWAWSAAGSPKPGFPIDTGSFSVAVPVALADLDGQPGVEIVAAGADGVVHAYRSDGIDLDGWPQTIEAGPLAPSIAHWSGEPFVVVAADSTVHAFRANGASFFTRTLTGLAVTEPAIADLDGDGSDDVLVASSNLHDLHAIDLTGGPLVGWPAPLPSPVTGTPVVGPIASSAARGALVRVTTGLVALAANGQRIPTFPKPGGAGGAPTLADPDADGATEVVAGSGADSSIYVYDAGAGTWADSTASWLTARGNFARTGNRDYAPALDATAPSAVSDLTAAAPAPDTLLLTWTAPGDDAAIGRATAYEIRVSTMKTEPGRLVETVPAPAPAGTLQTLIVPGVAPNTTYYVTLRARDDAGNVSPPSNVAAAITPLGGVRRGDVSIVALARPARGTAPLRWSGVGGEGQIVRVFDLAGRRVRTLRLGVEREGVVEWNGRDDENRRVPAGLYFARLVSGSFHTQTRVVLLP